MRSNITFYITLKLIKKSNQNVQIKGKINKNSLLWIFFCQYEFTSGIDDDMLLVRITDLSAFLSPSSGPARCCSLFWWPKTIRRGIWPISFYVSITCVTINDSAIRMHFRGRDVWFWLEVGVTGISKSVIDSCLYFWFESRYKKWKNKH